MMEPAAIAAHAPAEARRLADMMAEATASDGALRPPLPTHAGMGYPLPMLELVTHATFAEYLGERFRMHVDAERTLEVELIEVARYDPRGAEAAGSRPEPFSVLFRGPLSPVVPQRIYAIEHDRFGRLELFLVPIGPDDQGMRYEAVFS